MAIKNENYLDAIQIDFLYEILPECSKCMLEPDEYCNHIIKKKKILQFVDNSEILGQINELQAIKLHTSNLIKRPREMIRDTLNSLCISSMRIVHDSKYEPLQWHPDYIRKLASELKKLEFEDQHGHEPLTSYRLRFDFLLGDIARLIKQATALESFSIRNAFVFTSTLESICNMNQLYELKLINCADFLSEKYVANIMKSLKSLRSFHFYADKENKVQTRETIITTVYENIHKMTVLFEISLNAFGYKTKYENLLKLKNLQACRFLVDRFRVSNRLVRILPKLKANYICVVIDDFSDARELCVDISDDETNKYHCMSANNDKIKLEFNHN